MVNYNIDLLNENALSHSFFCLDQSDPTIGFQYDASIFCGPTYPRLEDAVPDHDTQLCQRLILGSHLARHLRLELEAEKGYTSTAGVSTNKILSKLVGNLNKPKNQTTLAPPYESTSTLTSNAITFMDAHDIGKVPGLGFKLSQKIRARTLGRPQGALEGWEAGFTPEKLSVRDVRMFAGMGPEMLEDLLSGPGSQKGIGGKIWDLLHGVDDAEVSRAKKVPSQISIEDSYKALEGLEEVKKELAKLSTSLIRRMHSDLTEDDDSDTPDKGSAKRWLAHPRTLRLSTRPRLALHPDGTRPRAFKRISRSVPMPTFAFSQSENVHVLAERLARETLLPTFRKLHPDNSGWNLSLINVAVTNMTETAAAGTKGGRGRDISTMFKNQDEVLKEWRVADVDAAPEPCVSEEQKADAVHFDDDDDTRTSIDPLATVPDSWESDDSDEDEMHLCDRCGISVPSFAHTAHERFHEMPD